MESMVGKSKYRTETIHSTETERISSTANYSAIQTTIQRLRPLRQKQFIKLKQKQFTQLKQKQFIQLKQKQFIQQKQKQFIQLKHK